MIEKVVYVLPHADFFRKRTGRSAHALGVIEGLSLEGCAVVVVTGREDGVGLDTTSVPIVSVAATGLRSIRGLWLISLFITLVRLRTIHDSPQTLVIVRYSILAGPLLSIALLFWRDSVRAWEINSVASTYVTARWIKAILRPVEGLFLSAGELLLPVSDQLRQELCVMSSDVQVVPNGVPLHVVRANTPTDPSGDIRRVVYFGSLERYYDLETVIDSIETLRLGGVDIRLDIYGDGPGLESIVKRTAGSSSITAHGYIEFEHLKSIDLSDAALILPYGPDSMVRSPVKMFEYLAFCRPIIAQAYANVPDVLGQSALYYTLASSTEVSESILQLMNDHALVERLRKHAYRLAQENSWQARASIILASAGRRV